MERRGVSPVVGIALMVGLTAVVAITVIVVGISVVDDARSTAEVATAEDSMAEFAQTADAIAEGESGSSGFAIGGEQNTDARVNESAGHVTVDIVRGDGTQTITDTALGEYRYEASDGTVVAYQGGGVFRHGSGDPRVVEAPSIGHDEQTNESTLDLSIKRIRGNPAAAGSVDSQLTVTDRTSLLDAADLENPITGDRIEVLIRSEYCAAWADSVSESTALDVDESCGDDGEVVFSTELPDPEDGEERDPPDEWFGEDAVRTATDFQVVTGGDGEINGNVSAVGDIDYPSHSFDITNENNIDEVSASHDVEIANRIANGAGQWGQLCRGNDNCAYGAGTHYVSNDDLDGGADEDVVLDLTDGNVTLVLNTSLELTAGNDLIVRNVSTGNVARIFTNDDLMFRHNAEVGPENPADFTDVEDDYTGNASAFRIYGSSDSELVLHGRSKFEGLFDAPPGQNGTSLVHDEDNGLHGNIAGSFRANEFFFEHGSYEHVYDESLASGKGDFKHTGDPPNPSDEQFYLHVTDTELLVEG